MKLEIEKREIWKEDCKLIRKSIIIILIQDWNWIGERFGQKSQQTLYVELWKVNLLKMLELSTDSATETRTGMFVENRHDRR